MCIFHILYTVEIKKTFALLHNKALIISYYTGLIKFKYAIIVE